MVVAEFYVRQFEQANSASTTNGSGHDHITRKSVVKALRQCNIFQTHWKVIYSNDVEQAVTKATASKMASTQPRETSSGTPVTSSSSVNRELVLPSSNGGADGAIGVCSLNLL